MKFRKKPVVIEVIEAHRWNPHEKPTLMPDWLWEELSSNINGLNERTGSVSIRTLEGDMLAVPGDWIIRGVKGDIYPCKPDIFEKTYEPVEDA